MANKYNAHIVVKGTINLRAGMNNMPRKDVAVKNNAQYRSCISEINKKLIGSADDLDIVMSK